MKFDVVIIGAGASGLFAGSQIAQGNKKVLILDNGKKAGRKILISGGGLCNFTNLNVNEDNYISSNPHFVKSALRGFTQWDFISLINEYKIKYYEKELGQLFTNEGASLIVNMLLSECKKYNVEIRFNQNIEEIIKLDDKDVFKIILENNAIEAKCIVVATGGLSFATLGVSPFGYKIAQNFGLKIIPPRASLVPFAWRMNDKIYSKLSGVSLLVCVRSKNKASFTNKMLFTHRGISGPAILQISNYWEEGESLIIDLLPKKDIGKIIQSSRNSKSKLQLKTLLAQELPKKLIDIWLELKIIKNIECSQTSNKTIDEIKNIIHNWEFFPNGTCGYKNAEVTKGGVDVEELSSKTLESKKIKNLYFIGEVVDVTGWLGGYNFQWAWSSAFACAKDIKNKTVI